MLREWIFLTVLLLAQAALLVHQAWVTGVTVDEPAHVLSASLYWKGNDILRPRDMPPAIKIAAGMMPVVRKLPVPYHKPAWKNLDEWNLAQDLVELLPPARLHRTFFQARLPLILFPLLTCAVIFTWGRALFGFVPAAVAATLFAFEPTALGHGALVKNDHAAALGYLLFWFQAWRYWRDPSTRNVLLLALAMSAAIFAKLSLLILLPAGTLILLLRGARWRVFLAPAVVYLCTLAGSWFDTGPLPAARFAEIAADSRPPAWVHAGAWLFQFIPTPMLMFEGVVSLSQSHAAGNPVYLLGSKYPQGSPWYFLVAWAVKSPEALQILLIAGIAAAFLLARRKELNALPFLLAPPVIYITGASMVSMQLGFRLILPALPFAVLLCAAAFRYLEQHRARFALYALLAWFLSATAWNYCALIGYFNLWAGGRSNGLTYLADSNIDWGQDLRALRHWYDAAKPSGLKLFYFGNDSPASYFADSEITRLAPPWSPGLVKSDRFEPQPGYYAVSANLIPGHMFEDRFRGYFAAFRKMTPVHRAGSSIYIYKVN
ncbi:MAG: hypothetical protein FJW39_28525 [Acidobacteria bacterium]|nr:hypothetical protein [Acidobacteriota bacterium]